MKKIFSKFFYSLIGTEEKTYNHDSILGDVELAKITCLHNLKTPNWIRVLSNILIAFFLFTVFLLSFTPWQQTSQGSGQIIALDPNDRVQMINSSVPGRINKWFVIDGSKVKTGDPIVEIIDNDPLFLDRLKVERDAILRNYQATKSASETAYINFKRQKELFEQGLNSKLDYEKAKIEYQKLLSSEATAAAYLAHAEVKLSRQQTQLITAPRNGTILRVLHGSGSVMVNEGTVLASFVPETLKTAAEIYITGNDLPLIFPGRHVRLQFEGWPAVQFSGWPSLAIGTFGGVVSTVDPSISKNGKFRIIVTPLPGEIWPDNTFLRQGTRAFGWVLLDTVKLGYELWRKFNGFPPSLDSPPDDLLEYQSSYKKSKSKTEKKYEDLNKEK